MEKLKVKRTGIIFLMLFAAAAGGIMLLAQQPQRTGLELEQNATVGILPGVDLEERRKQLQQQLDDSQIAFSINTSPTFSTGAAQGDLMLENPANNAKLITAQVVLDETDETLFQSGALTPGTYLEKIQLARVLAKGRYPATVYLKAYTEDTQEWIGQTGAAITIVVLA